MLKNILNGSDLVKFAKYKPEPSENELHFGNSRTFVDITKLLPEITGSVNENDGKESES
jgi:hypothetical protein